MHKVDDLREVPLDELPERGGPPTSMKHYSVQYELRRRQTEAQIQTAEYTRRSARWIFISVVVLMLASLGSFVLDLLIFAWRAE
jgi:hypothetical protein